MAGLEFHVSAENRDFINKLNQLQSKVSETTKKVEEEGNDIDAIFKKIGSSMAALGAGFSATKLISDIVRVRGEFQQLEIAMETMLGSQEKATALMSQLTTTAAKTPFGLTDIAQGAKQLLAYGTASEEVNDTLVRLGNIASGLSIPLNDLVYLYGTTMTQGRLFTQDLRQFMGRGIPLADELAKQFGVTKDKVGELVTEGKVGFPEVEKAILSLTNEGGKFYNLMEKQSASLTGQISNLEDSLDIMLNEIGEKSQGVISDTIGVVSDLVENYKQVGETIAKIAVVFGTYKAALATMSALNAVAIKTETDMLLRLLAVEAQQNAVENAGVAITGRVVAANEVEIVTLRQQLAAKMQSLQTTLLMAKGEEAAARTKVERLMVEVSLSKIRTRQLKEELALAVASGNAEAIATARTNLATAARERNTASRALGVATRELEIAATNTETASSAVNTLQTNIETAAIDNQTRATLLLTAAKQKLAAIGRGIGAVLSNPYVLAAAAVAALAASIIGAVDAWYVEDEAHRNVTDAIKKHNEALDEYKRKGEELISAINDETRTNIEKARAITELRALYPALFKDMSDAEILTMSQADANKKLAEETDRLREEELRLSLQRKRDALSEQEGIDTVVGANGATYRVDTSNSVQARRLREEIKLLEKELADLEELKRRAEFNALPKEAKIVSLKEQITSLEEENKQLDEQIQEIGAKKWTIEELGNSNFDWKGNFLTEELIAKIEANRERVAALFKEIEKLEKVEDEGSDDITEEAIKKAKKAQEKVDDALTKAEYELSKAKTEDEIKLIELERNAKVNALKEELEAYKAIYQAAGKDTTLLEQQYARMIEIENQLADIKIKGVNKKKSDETKEELDELLKEFESYQQAVARIEKEYDDKRKKMYEADGKTFKAGFGEDNITELERKKKEAIEDVAETYAGKSKAFETWADSLSSIALDKLKQMLALAKAQLQILKNTEGADELEIANVESAIANIESAIRGSDDATKKSSANWTELNKVLNECAETFSDLGNVIPGLTGEILSGVGQIASASVGVANGIHAIGEAASAAEKASAVLSIISSVIKIVEKFTSIAEKNEDANNKAADAARNYAEALEDISEAEAINKNDTIFGRNVFGELLANADKAIHSLNDINSLLEKGAVLSESLGKVDTSWIDVNQSGVPGVEGSIFNGGDFLLDYTTSDEAKKYGSQLASDMRTGWQQFWGMDKNKSVFDLSSLMNKGLGFSITDLINEDKFKEFEAWYKEWGDGLSDENKQIAEQILQEWEDYQEAMEQIKENVKSFFSNVSSSVVDSMLDNWISTGNAIADATALVGDYSRALAKAAAEKFLLEKVFSTAEQDMLDLMMRGDTEGAVALIKGLIEDANDYAPEIAKIFEAINEASAGALENTSEKSSEREAYKKEGITASQESVDKVDARLTTMQGHTYSISESCKMTANYSSQMVSRLISIERNTSHLADISERIKDLSSDIEDIKNKGIPML